jgi:ribonuclease HI
MPNVTVNTDASFMPVEKVGGFAYWIVIENKRFRHSGPLRGLIVNSISAEIKAIANALFALTDIVKINNSRLDVLYINTDCKHAIEAINKGTSQLGFSEESELVRQLIRKLNPRKTEWRHVKAHSGTESARKYVNDFLDSEAKRHARELRSKIRKETNGKTNL